MRRLTLEQWLDLMPIVAGRQWSEGKFGSIRCERGYCPLVAFAKEIDPDAAPHTFVDYRAALREVGLLIQRRFEGPDEAIIDLINAADSRTGTKWVRERLKIALGLPV